MKIKNIYFQMICFLILCLIFNLAIGFNLESITNANEESKCKDSSSKCYSRSNCASEAHSYCWTYCAWWGEECEDYELINDLYCAEMGKDYCVCCGLWQIKCNEMYKDQYFCCEWAEECYKVPVK